MQLNILNKNNLVAWCIVPYDIVNRDANERVKLLNDLELSKFAYDWRSEHLPSMADELNLMIKNNIEITAVWFWVDGKGANLFDNHNEFILKTLLENNIKTDLWIGVPEKYFGNANDSLKLEKAAALIDFTYKKAKEINCTISLYNHGGWFGEPKNQLAIIEKLGHSNIGMIYNFHHAHDQINYFPHNLKYMIPYLRCVNINGMNTKGPKILTVGDGNEEYKMIKVMINEGYKGPICIIGHKENSDVKEVLLENINGIEKIKKKLLKEY